MNAARIRRLPLLALLTTLGLTGCDSSDGDGKKADGGDKAEKSDGGGDDGGEASDKEDGGDTKKKKGKKDFGDATAKIDGNPWEAEIASARIKGDMLKLSISRMDTVDGKTSRDAFELSVKDYKGPGEYPLAMGMFVGVGFNTKALTDTKGEDGKVDDAKVTKEAVKAIGGAKTIMLHGAKIKIETDDNDQITGTLDHPTSRPPVTEMKFRAIVKKRE